MTAAPFPDPELDRVIDLSNAGHDWLTACRMVFAAHLMPGRVSVSERLRARLHAEAGAVESSLQMALGCLLGIVLVLGWVVLGSGAR